MGFGTVVYMERKSAVEMDNCSVRTGHIAISAQTSSSINVNNCAFQCQILLMTFANKQGRIIFKNSRMSDDSTPIFHLDERLSSPCLVHDFRAVRIESRDVTAAAATDAVPMKEKSKFTKATSGLWDAVCNEDKRIKYCERCRRIEPQDVADRRDSHMVDVTETEFKKFRYCIKCKRVCYCSKQCQTEDWKDHKHACKIFSQNETA